MATPVVSGTVALMLQQNPALTPDQLKARLMKTASKGLPRYTT
jgi:serine protease AprX